MRILIVEDDLASRKFMLSFLENHGECDVVVDGMEALEAYMIAFKEKKPYDLICLDIMMPKLDGVKTLKTIRELENQNSVEQNKKVKIIMTTALEGTQYVQSSFDYGCEGYAAKPINTEKLKEIMQKLGLI